MKKLFTILSKPKRSFKKLAPIILLIFYVNLGTVSASGPLWDSVKVWTWGTVAPNTGWLLSERNINLVYDANGNLLSGLRESSFPPSPNVTSYKTINTYDGYNNLLSSTIQVFLANSWITYAIVSNTYDANNNIVTSWQQTMNNGFTALETKRHTIATYDANSNRLSYLDSALQGGTWYISKVDNQYGVNNLMLRNVDQNWDTDKWLITSNWTRTYDNRNNRITQLDSVWSTNGFLQLVLQNRFINQYDPNNNLLSQLDSINKVKSVYTYDLNSNQLSKRLQGWNGSTLSFVTTFKTSSSFDANSNLLSKIDSTFNTPFSTVLRSISRIYYTYDANNKKLTELTQTWGGGSVFKDSKFSRFTYNSDKDQYILVNHYFNLGTGEISSGDSTYYYKGTGSTFVNRVPLKERDKTVSVFPNPAANLLNINCEKAITSVEIFNQTGSLQAAAVFENRVDVSTLLSGIYFIKIYTSEGVSTQIFVKE